MSDFDEYKQLKDAMDKMLQEMGQIRTNVAIIGEVIARINAEQDKLSKLLRGDNNGEQGMVLKQGFMMRDLSAISATLKDIETRLCTLEDNEIRRDARQTVAGYKEETVKEKWLFWGKTIAIVGACVTGFIELIKFIVDRLSQVH